MKKPMLLLAALLVTSSTLLTAAEHPAAPPIADQTITVTAETFAGLPRVKAEAKEHENPVASYEGVTLGSILERAGVPHGEKLRGKGLCAIVVITAVDGYEVVFTVAETDPAFNDRLIILADKKDGKPLPEKEGPFRIVVPTEKRPARWIRNVKSIAIKTVS
jgi:hypothetical protein